jgi:hypothetical protein
MRIVCGFGGEVERMGREEGDEVDVEGGIVGVVVMGCMMLVGVYVFIAWAWARYVESYITNHGWS